MFPSFNSIEEIKISETLNPAEFGGVADITTISKSGTNGLHGGLFEMSRTPSSMQPILLAISWLKTR
jgi:hypothetical protein